ncbi:MAG: helix-turn-helix transcriptional regulator, partial [Eggerthellaceae bacterium]|nr:helix-turn-helix transcriptional regulator [Eggerthellaceae bacterium]
LISLAIALLFLLKRLRGFEIPYTLFIIVSIACKLFASLALTLEIFAGSAAVAFAGALVGGLGVILSMLVWGSFFKDLPLEQALAYILLGYMGNFLLQPLCYIIFPTANTLIMSLLAVIGPLSLIFAFKAAQKTGSFDPVFAIAEASAAPDRLTRRAHSRDGSVRKLGPAPVFSKGKAKAADTQSKAASGAGAKRRQSPFLRLLVAFAIYSIVLTLRSPANFQSGTTAILILYFTAFLVTVLIYWLMIIRRAFPTFEHMMQLLLAAFAIGFFLQPFTPSPIIDVPPALLMVATALIYMLVWMSVIDIARVSKFHPFVIVGVWGACYGCPRLLYFAISAIFPLGNGSFEATITTALVALFCLFAAFFLISMHPPGSHSFFHGLHKQSRSVEKAAAPLVEWQRIATDHKLTERESEIFFMVCKGHSRRYIAEHLFISENTVKAHLKKIYAKTGIHSKYDLEQILSAGNDKTPRP